MVRVALPLLLAFLTTLPTTPTTAQAFDVGTNAINAGIGLGGYRFAYLGGVSRYSASPAIAVSYEHGVTELGPGILGVGGFFAQKGVRSEYTNNIGNTVFNYDQRWSNMIIGVRGSWHYNEWHGVPELDIYGGLMLGYNIGNFTDRSTRIINGVEQPWRENYGYSLNFVTWSTYFGARYLFADKLGAYMEFGYGIAYLNLGVTLVF